LTITRRNGTQDIFYERSDVLTISIHADPITNIRTTLVMRNETGAGPDSTSTTTFPSPQEQMMNIICPRWIEALNMIKKFEPKISGHLPRHGYLCRRSVGKFKVTREGFHEIGKRIAALIFGLFWLWNGGYANEALGENIVTLLGQII